MFNAFKYTKQLEEAGFSREQAEIQLQVISEIVEGELATKQDLEKTERGLKQGLEILSKDFEIRTNVLENQIQQVSKNFEIRTNVLESQIQHVEYRIIIKLGGFIAVCFTTMITLMKLWLPH